MQRRTYDIAACIAPVKIYYNNKLLTIKSFQDYVKLFKSATVENSEQNEVTDKIEDKILYKKLSNQFEIAVKLSSTGTFENMSFVNSVWTTRGGSHVTNITQQIVKSIEEVLIKKKIKVTNAFIKNKIFLFVNSKIENPMFDGQTKDSLSTKQSLFSENCQLDQVFLKKIIKESNIVESIIRDKNIADSNLLNLKNKKVVKKTLLIPKLEDALNAGNCFFIYTN
jgi:DNA topoisomerase-2